MKILLSWLNEYVDGGFADPADADAVADLAATLTNLGLEVDSVQPVGETVDGVITARVVRTEQHPDAAKVQRVWVDRGDGGKLHVWCGASNFAVGDVVPLAQLGTTMPNGMTIERRGILGIDSEGMLCAPDELGLGGDHGGILLLDSKTPLGVPYGEVLGIQPDVVIDVTLERNRPDCWGYTGIARDVAAKLGRQFTPPTPAAVKSGPARSVAVKLAAGPRCARFTATVMSGVQVTPSATWMQRRLTTAGMRPINNVVDVSNYVMLELNQPNHAYDLDTLGGGGFRVRTAAAGERLNTLDGIKRELHPDDTVICDDDDVPIGLGGVMGGLDTEITDTTTTVVLEAAWFDPLAILQSSQRHGLRSEASARFERGCDPYGMPLAIGRFAELLAETCPDLVIHADGTDARNDHLPSQQRRAQVRMWNVNRLLSSSLNAADLPALLDPIGFTVEEVDKTCTVTLPSWRPDATGEVDVIEEIGRHYGYDRIGKRVPQSPVQGGLSRYQQRRRALRQVLLGLGISEAMPNPFVAPDTMHKAGLDSPGLDGGAIHITNPLVVEESVLRTSLRPGLLNTIAYNESHRIANVALYELGHIYRPGQGELPDESEALCVVLAGCEAPAALRVWTEISAALGVGARIDQANPPAGLHATRSATLQAGKSIIGAVGEIDPAILKAFAVTSRVAIVEIDASTVLSLDPKPAMWKPVSRYPSSDFDMAFILPNDVPAERLDRAIRQGSQKYLVDLELFDIFRGPSVGDDARSLAYRLRLQSPDRNLIEADIAIIYESVVAAATKLGARIRDH